MSVRGHGLRSFVLSLDELPRNRALTVQKRSGRNGDKSIGDGTPRHELGQNFSGIRRRRHPDMAVAEGVKNIGRAASRARAPATNPASSADAPSTSRGGLSGIIRRQIVKKICGASRAACASGANSVSHSRPASSTVPASRKPPDIGVATKLNSESVVGTRGIASGSAPSDDSRVRSRAAPVSPAIAASVLE